MTGRPGGDFTRAQRDRLASALSVVGRGDIFGDLLESARTHQDKAVASDVILFSDHRFLLQDLVGPYQTYLNENRNNSIWLSDTWIDLMIMTRVTDRTVYNSGRARPHILGAARLLDMKSLLQKRLAIVHGAIMPQMMRVVATSTSEADVHGKMVTALIETQEMVMTESVPFRDQGYVDGERVRLYRLSYLYPMPPPEECRVPLLGPAPCKSRCLLIPQNNGTFHWWTVVILYDEVAHETVVCYYDSLQNHISHTEHVAACEKVLYELVTFGTIVPTALTTVQLYPRLTVPLQKDATTCGFQFLLRASAIEREIHTWPVTKPMTLANFQGLAELATPISREECRSRVDSWMLVFEALYDLFPKLPTIRKQTAAADKEKS